MNLKNILIAVLAVVTVWGAYLFYSSQKGNKKTDNPHISADAPSLIKSKVSEAKSESPVPAPVIPEEEEEAAVAPQLSNVLPVPEKSNQPKTLSEVEHDLARIDELLGEDGYKEALVLCKKWMASSDPEVRQDVAFSLGWMGVRALPELSRMLSDENKEVRDTAFNSWSDALDDLDEEDLKVEMLVAGISVLDDKDNIDAAVMQLETVSDKHAVNAMIRIIQNGVPVASEAAREHYSFVTGENYTTPQAARQWLEDNAE